MRALICLLLLAPAPAAADWMDSLELGVGVRGSLGGSYAGAPEVLTAEVEGVQVDPVPYEGWWGFGPGGGLNLDARLFGWLGLHRLLLRIHVSTTSGRGRGSHRPNRESPPCSPPVSASRARS